MSSHISVVNTKLFYLLHDKNLIIYFGVWFLCLVSVLLH